MSRGEVGGGVGNVWTEGWAWGQNPGGVSGPEVGEPRRGPGRGGLRPRGAAPAGWGGGRKEGGPRLRTLGLPRGLGLGRSWGWAGGIRTPQKRQGPRGWRQVGAGAGTRPLGMGVQTREDWVRAEEGTGRSWLRAARQRGLEEDGGAGPTERVPAARRRGGWWGGAEISAGPRGAGGRTP